MLVAPNQQAVINKWEFQIPLFSSRLRLDRSMPRYLYMYMYVCRYLVERYYLNDKRWDFMLFIYMVFIISEQPATYTSTNTYGIRSQGDRPGHVAMSVVLDTCM